MTTARTRLPSTAPSDPPRSEEATAPILGFRRAALWLSGAVLLVTSVASGLTFGADSVLTGPAAMNGSARGTALVLLVVTVPVLAVAMALAARGSVRAVIVWLGGLAHVAYNSQLFLYGTPFNHLFLMYVAMLGLSAWSIVALLAGGTVDRVAGSASPRLPVRSIAIYLWIIAALNATLWLSTIIPAVLGDRPSSVTDGMGIATNPVFVQDLALWLPLAAVSTAWLWRRQAWGYAASGAILVLWVLEGVSVAVDQWFGSQADPASAVVGASAVLPMAVLAAIGLVPLYLFLRNVSRARSAPRPQGWAEGPNGSTHR